MIPPRLVAAAAVMAVLIPLASKAQAQQQGQQQEGPLPVGVITMTASDVPMVVDLSGVAVASENAQIRPMVQGIVQQILYRPDQQMIAGDPMFQIDPTSYQAAVASAEANLQSAMAARDLAQANADRYAALSGRSVSAVDAQTARSTLRQAEAAVAVAEANLKTAAFNLDNTTVKSPITGQASVAGVSVGDLVTVGQATALTTVTRLDPIYADLADTSARMLRLRSMSASGMLEPGDRINVSLRLENGHTLDGGGRVISVGDHVSTSTGTFNVRVEVENPDRMVLPGMFVTASLTFGRIRAMLVPQVAAIPRADGTIAVFLAQDGRAVETAVQPAGSTADAWIVPAGIDEGSQLIVDNRDRLRDGAEIAPVPVTVETGGIVRPAEPAGPTAAADHRTAGG